jgi:hypothetical protein
MPQNAQTGRDGRDRGYADADAVANTIGAQRIGPNSNEFMLRNRRISIKTGGPAVVVTRATLGRVDSVLVGENPGGLWDLYEVDPPTFEQNSVQSLSSGHDDNYRSVPLTLVRNIGTAFPH